MAAISNDHHTIAAPSKLLPGALDRAFQRRFGRPSLRSQSRPSGVASPIAAARCLYTVTVMNGKVERIGDLFGPDVLYRLAERQAGYLTARQAVATGMPRSTLAHHARPGGRLQPVSRGVYRLRNFPPSPHEHIVAGWLRTPPSADAVVSHQSALELHDLSDIIADQIHVSVPRNRRRKAVAGLTLHVTQLPILPTERREMLGVPVTSPERTILDVLRDGGPNEQIELAIAQALRRGLTTRRRLASTAEAFPKTSQHHLAAILERVIQ